MNQPYKISEVKEIWLQSYTQNSKNYNLYTLDNIYFKKTNTEKFNTIYDMVKTGDYVIFDTETNWINNFWESLPFQIAAKRYRKWVVVDQINMIINIGIIPDEILTMTNYQQIDIDNGIDLSTAITKFNQFILWEKYIIAHNATFDVSILNNALVYTNTYLNRNINMICSMQIYYTLYKHIFELWISWSSLDQLSHILLGINISSDERHQADYDIWLVQELLLKIKLDIDYDLSQWDNSKINRVINIENSIIEKINQVWWFNYKDKNIISFVHSVWEDINELYNYYHEDLLIPNINISNAVSNYLERVSWQYYPEIFLRDELNELTYYIKKNKPYMVIDKRYAKTWYKTSTVYYTDKWYEISFFKENPYKETDIYINNEEELAYYIQIYVENKNNMMKYQMKIQYLMKIIKSHQSKSNFSRYGEIWKWIYLEVIKELTINDRTIDVDNIIYDYNKWVIDNINDLYEIKDYNTTLLVEQNLSNIFNIV